MKKPKVAAEIEEARQHDLAAKLKRMDVTELRLYAEKTGVDLSSAPHRDDIVAAIELKEENDAKAAAAQKAIEDDEKAQGEKIRDEADQRGPIERRVRALNAEFCRDVPQEARAGSFDPGEDHARFGGEYDVPDGRYRVVGSDWLFDIADKRVAGAQRATAQNNYGGKNVIAIG